jgi:hypothetical protein
VTSRIRFHTGQRHRAAALATVSLFSVALMLAQPAIAQSSSQGAQTNTCAGDNTGITLSLGRRCPISNLMRLAMRSSMFHVPCSMLLGLRGRSNFQ